MTKKNSGKAPAIQFYFKDWLADIKLKMIPKATKGVWIDLIAWSCCMPKMGVFFDENKALSEQEVVKLLDGKQSENKRCFKQLLDRKIIKKFDKDNYKNAFYIKRVYKDMCLREIRAKAGKQGGNPNLVKDLVNQNTKQTPTPSSSSSSSTSVNINNTHIESEHFLNFTLEVCKDTAVMVGLTEQQGEEFYHHFNAQGWIRSNGQKITNIQSALITWRKNQNESFGNRQKRQNDNGRVNNRLQKPSLR